MSALDRTTWAAAGFAVCFAGALGDHIFRDGFEPPACQQYEPLDIAPRARGSRNNEFISGSTFEEVFGPWPGDGSTYLLEVIRGEMISLPVRIEPVPVARILWEDSVQGAEWTVSVSACPGGVLTPIGPDCIVQAGRTGSSLIFADEPGFCSPPAGDYWLNIAPVGSDGLPSTASFATWLGTPR